MLAQTAVKIKAFTPQIRQALAKPFTATADRFRPQGEEAASAKAMRAAGEKETARFTAWFSRSRREIMRAQRLRYRVFSEEYGANIKAPFGLDRDRFDKHCLHLMVRDNHTGELVGYTRILTQCRLEKTGGFYSAGEFELGMVAQLNGRVAEIGRTCIHRDYRGGAVITVLWARLAQFMLEENIQYLIGCASLALGEGYDVAGITAQIRDSHFSASHQRVTPKRPAPPLPAAAEGSEERNKRMPPLLKAYLRMGAEICGEPCWDPEFNCLDFFVLMAVDRLPARYVQHFMQPRSTPALSQAV
ncbi:GNAT family N-acetyltransferase [Alcanivorax quisquiliarum]|uniref:L-ornithine N(alpha)-acyltransferase n=1 Tax=Alcanivorax quisquiliarum TaxID=2933565 RepID=A0ABT0E8T7_9GAMM|nr:GNAT family N-acetyltransferase [Alcanivorax quisquiliarum]MCK0538251.1 GNAT family N-acetyltransferase [Alcanivorax quisquiliarum]